jgi:hypothetical protein
MQIIVPTDEILGGIEIRIVVVLNFKLTPQDQKSCQHRVQLILLDTSVDQLPIFLLVQQHHVFKQNHGHVIKINTVHLHLFAPIWVNYQLSNKLTFYFFSKVQPLTFFFYTLSFYVFIKFIKRIIYFILRIYCQYFEIDYSYGKQKKSSL